MAKHGNRYFPRQDGDQTLGFIVGLAPVLMFWFIQLYTNEVYALWTAAALSAVIVVRNMQARRRRRFDLGVLALFIGLVIWTYLRHGALPPVTGTLVATVHLGLVLGSLALGQPFTLPYIRKHIAATTPDPVLLNTTHLRIAMAWALVFAILIPTQVLVVQDVFGPFVMGKLLPVALIGAGLVLSDGYFDRAIRRSGP